ncbi:MAG: SMC-Scp complex subunit ScpB, partial [Clostridia bacterium]|nr:SMC-Scp complex subunit ScpB [Deltaproteobacteria bacterium]
MSRNTRERERHSGQDVLDANGEDDNVDNDAKPRSEEVPSLDEAFETKAAESAPSGSIYDESKAVGEGPAPAELPYVEEPLEPVDVELIASACEAIIFAAGDPVQSADIKAVLERSYTNDVERVRKHKLEHFRDAMKLLRERWASHGEARGFGLFEVAEGLTFRSNPRYADTLRETRVQRPVRLSRPALETLAIIAYRQPVTKPEIDHIRGVDCGGT